MPCHAPRVTVPGRLWAVPTGKSRPGRPPRHGRRSCEAAPPGISLTFAGRGATIDGIALHDCQGRPMTPGDPVTDWIAQVKGGRRSAVPHLLERYFRRLV